MSFQRIKESMRSLRERRLNEAPDLVADIIMGTSDTIHTSFGKKTRRGLAKMVARHKPEDAAKAILNGANSIDTTRGDMNMEKLKSLLDPESEDYPKGRGEEPVDNGDGTDDSEGEGGDQNGQKPPQKPPQGQNGPQGGGQPGPPQKGAQQENLGEATRTFKGKVFGRKVSVTAPSSGSTSVPDADAILHWGKSSLKLGNDLPGDLATLIPDGFLTKRVSDASAWRGFIERAVGKGLMESTMNEARTFSQMIDKHIQQVQRLLRDLRAAERSGDKDKIKQVRKDIMRQLDDFIPQNKRHLVPRSVESRAFEQSLVGLLEELRYERQQEAARRFKSPNHVHESVRLMREAKPLTRGGHPGDHEMGGKRVKADMSLRDNPDQTKEHPTLTAYRKGNRVLVVYDDSRLSPFTMEFPDKSAAQQWMKVNLGESCQLGEGGGDAADVLINMEGFYRRIEATIDDLKRRNPRSRRDVEEAFRDIAQDAVSHVGGHTVDSIVDDLTRYYYASVEEATARPTLDELHRKVVVEG